MGKDIYIICNSKPRVFYEKSRFVQLLAQDHHGRIALENVDKPAESITTIKDMKICKVEHGRLTKWHRSPGGNHNTIEVLIFVIYVPAKVSHASNESISNITKHIFFKVSKPHKQNPHGLLTQDFANSLLNTHAPRGIGLYG